MKRIFFGILIIILLSSIGRSQTLGTLDFSFTTTSVGGYSPRHCVAAWVTDESNSFVKTKIKFALNYEYKLLSWLASSSGNVVDAVTGPTLLNHGTLTGKWNGTDINGNIMPDGNYSFQLEIVWGNNTSTQRSTYFVNFVKGDSADHQTGSSTNFPSVTLDWIPATGIYEQSANNEKISVFPNPFTIGSKIGYSIEKRGMIYVAIYDINGKLIKTLLNDEQFPGKYTLDWNGMDNNSHIVSSGIYQITFLIDNKIYTRKVVFNK